MLGGVTSMARFFWITVSLPPNQRHHERSRAVTLRTAGPSLRPFSLVARTAIFCSGTGWANCSVAIGWSVPPDDRVAVTDFSPAPLSLTTISSGAVPSTSASGASRICGASRSKRGHRYQATATSPAITIKRKMRPVRRVGVLDSKALMIEGEFFEAAILEREAKKGYRTAGVCLLPLVILR